MKFYPRTGHESPDGKYRCSPTLSLTSGLDGAGGECYALAALTLGKRQANNCTGGCVGLRDRLDGRWKSRPSWYWVCRPSNPWWDTSMRFLFCPQTLNVKIRDFFSGEMCFVRKQHCGNEIGVSTLLQQPLRERKLCGKIRLWRGLLAVDCVATTLADAVLSRSSFEKHSP
jgi:hypothetical protein